MLTKPQKLIFTSNSRFRVVVAGRRFGKTVLGINECLYEAQRGTRRLVWYVAPTYKMAKDLVWEDLKDAIGRDMIAKKNETDLSIVIKGYNSKICLKGADNPDSLRGKGLDHIVIDEGADIDETVWYEVLYPALTDKKGGGLFIGTPKGFNWFYDLFLYAEATDNWSAFQFTTAEGGNVSKEEIEYARAVMSERQFKQEFLASFQTLSGRVYSSFERKNNVDSGIEDVGGDILVGMDFNVDPMSAVVASRVTDQLHQFDEITIPNGNTEEMCMELKARYPNRKITIYPDPSGKARKTSSPVGVTDFKIIKDFKFNLVAPRKAPLVVDRVNEVNALSLNAKKEKRYFVNPKCKSTIKCLEGLTYKKGTSVPDKSLGLDHLPDALGYLVHSEFPINAKTLSQSKLAGV